MQLNEQGVGWLALDGSGTILEWTIRLPMILNTPSPPYESV